MRNKESCFLHNLGEKTIIEKYISPLLDTSISDCTLDDCAVIHQNNGPTLLISIDQGPSITFLELLEIGTPEDIGHFHVTMNVSDIAAMGGEPKWILLAICLKGNETSQYLKSYLSGIKSGLSDYNISLIGGDTKEANNNSSTITIIGYSDSNMILKRKGACPGDKIFISSKIGRTLSNYIEVKRKQSISKEKCEVLRPKARIGFANKLASLRICTSCMDMSDGLFATAEELGNTNSVLFDINTVDLPIVSPRDGVFNKEEWKNFLLNVGGDFELMFTTKEKDVLSAQALGGIMIGEVKSTGSRFGLNKDLFLENDLVFSPWEHFRSTKDIGDMLRSFI